MIKIGSKVKIVAIVKRDAYYEDRHILLREEGIVLSLRHNGGGWFSCSLILLQKISDIEKPLFFGVKLQEVKS